MADQPIRLIVADLDGTLLNSNHEVAPFTAAAVDAAIERGVLFTVATGKTFSSTPAIIRRFRVTIPVICGNGTQVFGPDGTLIHEEPIPIDYALEAVRLAQQTGFRAIVYTREGLLTDLRDDNVAELVAHHEPEPHIVPDIVSALRNHHKPYKLVLMNRDLAAVEDFQERITGMFAGRAEVVRSGLASLVEIMPSGVTKGTALQVILDHVGVPAEQTIAFGDNCNDVAMLRLVGIGVAMGHSPQDVRDQADYVTGTNDEDGVGHALHKFVLAPQVTEHNQEKSES